MRQTKLQSVAIPVAPTTPSAAGDGADTTPYASAVDGSVPARCLAQVRIQGGSTKLTLWAQSPSGDHSWCQLVDSGGNLGHLAGGQLLPAGSYCMVLESVLMFPRLAVASHDSTGSPTVTVALWGMIEKEEK